MYTKYILSNSFAHMQYNIKIAHMVCVSLGLRVGSRFRIKDNGLGYG